MKRNKSHSGVARRSATALAVALALGLAARLAPGADDERARPPVEVHEWSVWVGSPAQDTLNGARVAPNAMPGPVGTSRPKADDAKGDAPARKKGPAPISVVQFFGQPTRDLDVDLRVAKGALLAHWPKAAERSGRLQWFKSDLARDRTDDAPEGYLPETHWFQALRQVEGALYLKHESRAERFLAYDAELAVPIPVRLRGGPDAYTIQNLTPHRLLDVAIVAPTEAGYRVGWLDELPTAVQESADEAEKKSKKDDPKAAKKPDAERAGELFDKADADAKSGEDADKPKPKPLPAEAGPDIRARVDQALNRPVSVSVEQASRKELLDLVAGQARLRFELDDPTLAEADVNLGDAMSLQAPRSAARDVLAEVLGTAGLSYRVAEDGSLFVTTAARLAEEEGKKGVAIEGPPVSLTLSQPLKADNPSYRELTRDSYARRLAGRGLRAEALAAMLDQYAADLFEPDDLIVIAHLAPEAIEEAVELDVFPEPEKVVRIAAVVARGIDPRLQDRARDLVKRLGDATPTARESAETQLFELGPVAVPALEDALRDEDVEIVFRAERILMRLNRPVP